VRPAQHIPVTTPGGSYDVSVGPGLLHTVGGTVRRLAPGARCFLVTDANVAKLYGTAVETSILEAGVDLFVATQPAGEKEKSWHEAGMMMELLSEAGFGRDSVLVALGGGVVGDMAGFVASVYMRGVPVIQVPTTLLAQVDSAIGGKTGVDLRHGKNLAGTYWQPLAVLADTSCLSTLPEQEWSCGFAEVAKSAVLAGDDQMGDLELAVPALLAGDESTVTSTVLMAAGFKADVVSADEREASGREQLNYGHTLGHALERELGYGTVPHGVAVAEGVRFAAALSGLLAGASQHWIGRQGRLLDALGLARRSFDVAPDRLLAAMHADKKARDGKVRFVLSAGPGQWSAATVEDGILLGELESWRDTGRDVA
jgi:3-dehydroquinate synthase